MLFFTATCESNHQRQAGGGGAGGGEREEKQEMILVITLGVSLQDADGGLMMSAVY